MSQPLILMATLPYEKGRRSAWNGGALERPEVKHGETVISEIVGESVLISYELKKASYGEWVDGINRLYKHTDGINEGNADAVWAIVKSQFNVNKVPNSYYMPIVKRLLYVKGWGDFWDIFTIVEDQSGFGYMGGTGCGSLIHDLRFHKVMGVKEELGASATPGTQDHLKWVLATLLFSHMLGEVKGIRQGNKRLREAVAEDDIFVTLNARPMCQATVHCHGAHGYPVRNGKIEDTSCTKCAKKLGVTANAAGRRKAGAHV